MKRYCQHQCRLKQEDVWKMDDLSQNHCACSFVSNPFGKPVGFPKKGHWSTNSQEHTMIVSPSVGPTVANTIPRILKRKISKSYWSLAIPLGLAVPRLSSPRGSREASKRTSDKKLTDRSGKLLSTRLGEAGRSAHRRNGLEGFFPQKKPYIENRWDLTWEVWWWKWWEKVKY